MGYISSLYITEIPLMEQEALRSLGVLSGLNLSFMVEYELSWGLRKELILVWAGDGWSLCLKTGNLNVGYCGYLVGCSSGVRGLFL